MIWAPQLASQLVDLTAATKDVVAKHFPSIIQSQTVDGKLVALPIFTDAPALYYRKDLLDKYGAKVPTTWKEMADTAKLVMDKERAAGSKDMWGFVFQGNAYEGLTCDALEWVMSNGGGQIIEPDGTVSINNRQAAAALDMVKGWIGTISPPGVLAYQEEESRGVWQTGNAVFMRNWPYAYALGNSADAPIKGKFDVAPLPAGTGEGARPVATLGGWNLAVSKYSKHADAAIDLVKFVASPEMQKYRTLRTSNLPTNQEYIKRLMGLPGDTLAVKSGAVWINGGQVSEPYIAEPPKYTGSWQLGPDEYFVMGDNRNDSDDSHIWGSVHRRAITGKVVLVYWPLNQARLAPNFSFGTP